MARLSPPYSHQSPVTRLLRETQPSVTTINTYAGGAVASELVAVGGDHGHEGEEDGDLQGTVEEVSYRC